MELFPEPFEIAESAGLLLTPLTIVKPLSDNEIAALPIDKKFSISIL